MDVLYGDDDPGSKELFARERPSEAATSAMRAMESMNTSHNYAFPSGHTCCVTVLTGLALFVLLDPTRAAIAEMTISSTTAAASTRSGGDDGQSSTGKSQAATVTTPAPALTRQPRGKLALWIAATAITAAARIEGDRHWLSDTMAGAALGVVFVSACLAAGPCLFTFRDVSVHIRYRVYSYS